MGWKYLKVLSGGSSSTEFNPIEMNILAGTTQCQVGGSIESDRAPMWSTLATIIDGNLSTATYWTAGTKPTVTVTMPVEHTDLTKIEIPHTFAHYQHTVWLSENKTDWILCPFTGFTNVNKQQNFSIPALPEPEPPPTGDGTPVNWINSANVSISNGTLTKISGGSAWNAGAKGDIFYQADDDVFFEVKADKLIDLCFGFTERDLVTAGDVTENITYKFDLYLDGTYRIYCYNQGVKTGPYNAGDTFKVHLLGDGTVDFYKNDVFLEGFAGTIYWPMYIDASIYKVGDKLTAGINGLLATGTHFNQLADHTDLDINHDEQIQYTQNSLSFEQTGQLNLNFSESGEKIYTPKGYDFSQMTFETQSVYFYADSIFTPKGYQYTQEATNTLPPLNDVATQDYQAKGYSFSSTSGLEEILLDFDAAQNYNPVGYSFDQHSQEMIFFDFVGAASYIPEGYDVSSVAQENILLVVAASQTYTAKGLSFSATSEMFLTDLVDTAALSFQAHFEQSKEESFFLDFEGNQEFAAHYENSGGLILDLGYEADQIYTAVGYDTENVIVEPISLDYNSTQLFTAHFESSISETIPLVFFFGFVEFQANFEAKAEATLFMEDLALEETVFSNGLQFVENMSSTFSLQFEAVQTIDAFEGFQFNQNSSDLLSFSFSSALLYEEGEIGKYSQRATLYLSLQVSTQKVYENNWLTFESAITENIPGFEVIAANDYTRVYIFEAGANEDLTFFISPKSFFGKYNQATGANELFLVDAAANVYDQNYLVFEMKANEFIAAHFTDISIHTVNYLSFSTEMYYDFLFWADAYSDYELQKKSFESLSSEIIDLYMSTSGQYVNANFLNSFASDTIGLNHSGVSTFEAAQINHFNMVTSLQINLSFGSTSEFTQTTIYHFESAISENVGLSFGSGSEYLRVFLFDTDIVENIGLNVQAIVQYQHINAFTSKALESLYFEAFGTFEVTTEPRNHELFSDDQMDLIFYSWVYFESDIYQPTYTLEITKPNTLWEPLPEDRAMVEANKIPAQGMDYSDTSFGQSQHILIDKRILGLTHIAEPTKISYETESQKPNTLYTKMDEDKGGLS